MTRKLLIGFRFKTGLLSPGWGYTCTQVRDKVELMEALFIELPPFERHRAEYISDDEYRSFQQMLLAQPNCGDVIPHSGGLRKVRFADSRRQKGKRGGIRVIYYWYLEKTHFLLFTLYDKNQLDDLTPQQLSILRQLLEHAKMRTR